MNFIDFLTGLDSLAVLWQEILHRPGWDGLHTEKINE
jgi:hypothetical protein